MASSEEDAQSQIYDALLREAQLEVALERHAIAKTTAGSTSLLHQDSDRRTLFGIYESDEQMQEQLDLYAVEREVQEQGHHRSTDESYDETQKSSLAASGRDLWDRFPGKEPPEPIVCQFCQKGVNGQRFAQHLDKCLNINTTARTSAVNNSRPVSTTSFASSM